MRGHILCEMNVPFGPRFGFGPHHGRHGPFGPPHFNFGRPCSFGAFDGFGPRHHFGRPEHGPHGHRSSCEDSSPERECGRGRHGRKHGSPGRHERRGCEGPRSHGHHHGPHRDRGSPVRGPHGPCCPPPPPGPPGYPGGDFCPPPPGPHGPSGWHGPGHHGGPYSHGPQGRHGHGPYGPHGYGPHPPSFGSQCCPPNYYEGIRSCDRNKERCCSKGRKPRRPSDEFSGESCRRRCRKDSPRRGCCGDSDSSPERHGRQGPHRRCRSKSRFNPCGRGGCESGPCARRNKRQNANECVTRNDRAGDAEDHGENQGPGILVQNIVVDNTPRANSV